MKQVIVNNIGRHLRYNTKKFITNKPILITSDEGDISILATNKFNFKGILYAPKGTVTITGCDVDFDGIVIAKKIFITGKDTVIKNTLDLNDFMVNYDEYTFN